MGRSRGERVAELAGEGRFEEALSEALVLAREAESPVTLGQVGFLYEQLGQWAHAEKWLRRALADDPGYVTRHLPVALYSHTSVSADLHHMLGRVLQRQGQAEAARLHYHLAKRSDPTVALDPMYRDIMLAADLENHPGYDRADPRPPTGDKEFVEYLLELQSPEEVRRAAASAPFDEPGQVIALVAEQVQKQGRFLLAARLRVVLDVMLGDPETADLGWDTIRADHVRRLLDLAEMRQDGTVEAEEASVLATGIGVPPEDAPALLDLVWRFVRNDPSTGLVVATVVRPALAAVGWGDQAAVLVGRAQFGAGHLGAAAATIAAAVEELADDDPWLAEALMSLAVVNQRLGREEKASEAARRLAGIASLETESPALDERLDQAEQLIEDDRTDEALAVLRDVSPAPGGTLLIRKWVLIGNAHASRAEPEQVIEAWGTALFFARASSGLADQWPILMGLGRASLATGDRQAAREYIEAALEQSRDDPTREREGQALLQLGLLQVDDDPSAAIATVGRSLTMGPDDGGSTEEETQPRSSRRRRWRRLRRTRAQRGREEESTAALAEVARVAGLLHLDELGRVRSGLGALEAGAMMADVFDFLEVIDDLLAKILSPGKRALAALVAADLADHVGDLPHGIDLAERALEIATTEGRHDLEAEMRARGTLGRLVRLSGDFETARAHYERGAACARTLRDPDSEADLRGRLAITLRSLDLPDLALEHYTFAIDMAERRGDIATAALNRLNMAQSLILVARPAAAAEALQQAIRGFREQELDDLTGFALRVLAVLLPGRRLADDIRAALEELSPQVTSEFASREWTFEHLHMARTLTERGNHRATRNALEQMTQGLEQAGSPEITVLGHIEAARILAAAYPEHAWELTERAVTAAVNRTSQPRLVTDCHMARLDLTLAQGWDDRMDPLLPVLLADWTQLRRKLSTDVARIALADHMTAHLRPAVARLLQRDETARAFELWDALQAPAFNDLLDLVQNESAPDPNRTPAPGRGLTDVAGVLALSEIGDEVVAFVHRHPFDEPPLVVHTGLSATDLSALLRVFRREVHLFHGHGSRSWSRLARPLLAAVAPHLPSGGTLVLLLDAMVQELPVHAIPLPDDGTLVARFDLVHAPNLSGFSALRSRATADAEKPWPRLLTVGVAFPDEARALAVAHGGMCLSGNVLPKDQISRSMAEADLVHFACHGFFDPERPLDSGLLLTSRPSATSRLEVLSLRDLVTWRLTAGMVTLSACETGMGRPSPADYLGLARSVLAAGAAVVLVALWKIDDAATQQFMLDFYRELWRTADDGHLDPAGALSRTQRDWAATRPAQEWAPFRLIGTPTLLNGRAR